MPRKIIIDQKLEDAKLQLGKVYDDLLANKRGSVKKALAIHKIINTKMPVNAKSLMKAIEAAKQRIDKKNW